MHGGKECEGERKQEDKCEQLPACPGIYTIKSPSTRIIDLLKPFTVHCLFSEWGEWSACSVSCGDNGGAGTRERHRYPARVARNGGLECQGSTTQATTCVKCPDGEGESSSGGYGDGEKKQKDKHCITYCPGTVIIFHLHEPL